MGKEGSTVGDMAAGREDPESTSSFLRLVQVLLRITTADDPRTILEEILTATLELLAADYAAINTIPTRPGEQAWFARRGYRSPPEVLATVYPPGTGLAGRAMRSRAAVVVQEFGTDPAFPVAEFPVHVSEGMQSGMGLPLLRPNGEAGGRGEAFGALVVGYRQRRRISQDQVDLAMILAQQAAVALERARLLAIERQRAQENAHLYEDERRARRDLAQAKEQGETFLRIVAHDLKTPLTNIQGYAQLAQRLRGRLFKLSGAGGKELDDRLSATLDKIVDNCHRLHRLVDDLQEAFRLGSGRIELQKGPVDLVALTQQVLDEQRTFASGHQFRSSLPAQPVMGQWDPERVRQVITNLLTNAVKYSPDGGQITVVVRRDGEEAVLAVTDQGLGIPEEDIPSLFQPYSRLHRRRDIQGTGLGLYIVKGIVEAHGGSVRAASAGEGAGSTFTVTLPLGPATEPPESETTSSPAR